MPAEIAFVLLVLRVVVGLTMAAHGFGKFFTGGRLPGTARWFDSIGMKPGKLHALLAASTEVAAGLMLAAGLLTTFAAAGMVGLMAVAGWTVHRINGFFILKQGWEYVFLIAVVAVAIATLGPGDWSLDHALGIDQNLDGTVGLLFSAVGGVAAAVGLLAVFFRPPPATSS